MLANKKMKHGCIGIVNKSSERSANDLEQESIIVVAGAQAYVSK